MHDVCRIPQQEKHIQAEDARSGAHRLKSISVFGGVLDGVRLELAGGLNCLIGARGPRKKTALELLRYALDALPARETVATGSRLRANSA